MRFALLPALDVAAGQAVRLPKSTDGSATSAASPLDAALEWQREGAQRLHLVDLDAAFGRGSNAGLMAEVVARLDIPVQLAGGIRDERSLSAALATGCDRVVLSTSALADPRWCAGALTRHGDRIVVGLDVRGAQLSARGTVYVGGSVFDALPVLDAAGARRYVVTDVARDGTLGGPNLDLLRAVCDRTDRPVLASGGVGSLTDLRALAALSERGVEGAIVGKALLAGAFSLQEGQAASRGR